MGMFCFNEMYIIPIPASQSHYELYEPESFELSADPELFLDVEGNSAGGFSFLLFSSRLALYRITE